MRKIFYIAFAFILLLSMNSDVLAQNIGVPPYFSPEEHQRIVEKGYSDTDIWFFVIFGLFGIVVTIFLLHPKIKSKLNSDSELK